MNFETDPGLYLSKWTCSRCLLTVGSISTNAKFRLALFEGADGTTRTMGDVDLMADTPDREPEDPVEISGQVVELFEVRTSSGIGARHALGVHLVAQAAQSLAIDHDAV